MKQMLGDMVPFLSQDEIQKIVHKLAMEITEDYFGQELILVCPLRGSFMFLADLCRKIDNPLLKVQFLQAKSLGQSMRVLKDINMDIAGKAVLIVEEIVDEGRTLNYLKNHLAACHPLSIRVATLLDKPARRAVALRPDYVGQTIDDRYVIGYGMDSDGLGRNYPDIYNFMQ